MTDTATPEARPAAPAEVLRSARARRRAADEAEADLLGLAVDWAVMHPVESIGDEATYRLPGFGETDLALAGPGAPTVAGFCVAEFAPRWGCRPRPRSGTSGRRWSSVTASRDGGDG